MLEGAINSSLLKMVVIQEWNDTTGSLDCSRIRRASFVCLCFQCLKKTLSGLSPVQINTLLTGACRGQGEGSTQASVEMQRRQKESILKLSHLVLSL